MANNLTDPSGNQLVDDTIPTPRFLTDGLPGNTMGTLGLRMRIHAAIFWGTILLQGMINAESNAPIR